MLTMYIPNDLLIALIILNLLQPLYFPLTFLPKLYHFQLLIDQFLKKYSVDNTTSPVPLLLMTATFNNSMKQLLQKMIDLKYNHETHFGNNIIF